MKLKTIKQSLVALAAFNLVGFSPALATAPKVEKRPTLEKILRPVLKGQSLKTIGDFRKAFSKRLDDKGKANLEKHYGAYDKMKMPHIQINGDKLFVRIDKELVTLEFIGETDSFIKIHDMVFSAEEVSSQEAFTKKWARLNSKAQSKKSYSFIMNLLFPQAHALDLWSVAAGALMGVVGYYAWTNWLFPKKEEGIDKGTANRIAQKHYIEGYNAAMRQGAGSGGVQVIQ